MERAPCRYDADSKRPNFLALTNIRGPIITVNIRGLWCSACRWRGVSWKITQDCGLPCLAYSS